MTALPSPSSTTESADGPSRLRHVVHGVTGSARVVDYMKDRLALVPVTEIGDLITSGRVVISTRGEDPDAPRAPARTMDPVSDGDCIAIHDVALAALESASRWNPPWDHPLVVLHEDDDLLVVVKPAGMHVHPLGDRREHTLVNALVHHAGGRPGRPWAAWRPHAVQRLDVVVSGLLLVAKNAACKAELVRAQKRKAIRRTYRAMVSGVVASEGGVIDAPIGREPGRGYRRAVLPVESGGQEALTRWKRIETLADRTLVELQPESGRTHQLRVHLASLGHPIVDDGLYAADAAETIDRLGIAPIRPIALRATGLVFVHPKSGKELSFESPPPRDFGLGQLPDCYVAEP